MSLHNLFHPKSTAVIGSMSEGKLGAALALQIIEGGYKGELYAVNPKGAGYRTIPGYSSLLDIGKTIDLAVIASPANSIVQVLEECGNAGITNTVIITSGFSEIGNQEGERQIVAAAQKHNIRFIGPNSAGIVNTSHALYPTLELRPPPGKVALISQSGALGGVVLGWAKKQALGISKFVSYGNAADINEVDLLNYLSSDEETHVVAIYIESVRNGRAFMQALENCSRNKPVVLIKAGRTNAGQRATASHTGSMAGADAVYDAAVRQSGAIRVKTVEEMLDLCQGFIHTPRFTGNNIAIVTNSGGPGVLAADRAEELGMQVSEPSLQVKDKLKTFLPAHCSLKNPVDLTVEGTEVWYRETLRAMLVEYDAAVAINVLTPYLDAIGLAQGVIDAANTSKPVVVNFLPEQLAAESTAYLKKHNIPNFASAERAVTVLNQIAGYHRFQCKRKEAGVITSPPVQEPLHLPTEGQLLEPDAMLWLKQNNIPVPEFLCAYDEVEAVQACSAIGYPCVMKVVSPDILHKSDVGGVVVNIQDDESARKAFDKMQQAATGKDFRTVIIYPMIQHAQEVLVGMSRDAQFGPVIAFGLGGIYTEIWKDIVLRIAPIDIDDARAMIYSIKSIQLLTGTRGQKPCDLESLAQTLAIFSQLPFLYPELQEIDLNPVFLLQEGHVIGDVRVIRADQSTNIS